MPNNMKKIITYSKKLKLLYVEDNEQARETTLEMLKNFFTDIIVAIDGQDGLNKFHKNHFDLIISDINMPNLSGIEMLEKIRVDDVDIPVLILSAYNESEYFLESIKLGVDGFIIKPLEHNQFLFALKRVAEKIYLKKQSQEYQTHLEDEVKSRTKELQRRLHYDNLTGLLSRYRFFEDIEKVPEPTVLIIDINDFKIINEIYGSVTGSLVLKEFANFLLNFSNESSYKVYRLSGDEFAFWDDTANVDLEKCMQDINRFFRRLADFKVYIKNDFIAIDATIGVSAFHADAFESAHIALEYAKKHKKQYATFMGAIDKRQEEQDALLWKKRIKSAIQEQNIVPVYQPIVNQKGEIIKYETLMRLRDETSQELILPFLFLDVAIKTGLYNELSSNIIFEALHLLDTSQKTISFNFTYSDIKNSSFLNEIESFFKLSPEIGSRAVFEITESESIENYDDVKTFIKRFRDCGVKIAIDDFGTGFSNFEYILEIEPDYLKIDGSIIKNIDTDDKALVLVRAIVQFSHELGIKVIAEYVHSEVIFTMLKALHVDEFQGFYFSEPLEDIGE